MPFPEIPLPANPQVVGFNVNNALALPADGSPLVVAFDVPDWHWTPWSWTPPRRSVHVTTAFPSNSGVYGPNPPAIAGSYGVVAGPAIGQYATDYVMVRTLYPGRHFLVVRPQGQLTGPLPVGVAIA